MRIRKSASCFSFGSSPYSRRQKGEEREVAPLVRFSKWIGRVNNEGPRHRKRLRSGIFADMSQEARADPNRPAFMREDMNEWCDQQDLDPDGDRIYRFSKYGRRLHGCKMVAADGEPAGWRLPPHEKKGHKLRAI